MRTLLLSIAFAGALVLAQPAPEQFDEQVKAYVAAGKFNGAAAVARDGKILFAKGYGKANLEWDIPNAPDTKFRLGSITKQFTAMAILLLEQQGRLKVADPVSKHIPDTPESWKQITIHHLLTHTSGIPNFTSFPDYLKTMALPAPPAESYKRFRDKPLDFDPGTKFSYSNSGYILLGWIVERAGGMAYDEFMRKNIFEPLGMSDTGYDKNETVLAKRAAGYENRGRELRNASYIDMSIPHGAGALYSTVLDLVKWDGALRAGKILTPENYVRYFEPVKGNYAYGWMHRTAQDVKMIGHGGGINGFSTMILRVPEEKLVAVTLTNVLPSDAGRVAQDLVMIALGKPAEKPKVRTEVKVSEEILKGYVGEYELSPNFVMTVTFEDGMLQTQATGQGKTPIFAMSETTFFPKVVDAEITFDKDESGKVTGLTLFQNGRKMPAKKR
jgi:CubicO group peptidase (beta-lactamase class C family)